LIGSDHDTAASASDARGPDETGSMVPLAIPLRISQVWSASVPASQNTTCSDTVRHIKSWFCISGVPDST
jgi:hypothetical protein